MTAPQLRVVEGDKMDKHRALEAALAHIEKQFGKGSIMKLGANDHQIDVEAVSTGSLGLDIALGIGGLPKGRVVEIYGPESSGKTTLALHVVAEAQRNGGVCAFIDAEHALDPVYARKLGVNVAELLISQPDTGEQALEIADTLVRSGAVEILVINSVAALTPKAELEGEMGDSLPGLQARLMSQALRKLTGSISKSGCHRQARTEQGLNSSPWLVRTRRVADHPRPAGLVDRRQGRHRPAARHRASQRSACRRRVKLYYGYRSAWRGADAARAARELRSPRSPRRTCRRRRRARRHPCASRPKPPRRDASTAPPPALRTSHRRERVS